MTGFSLKKFLPRTLLGRSLMILIVPVVLIQMITAFIFFDSHWQRMTSRLALAVAGEITLLSKVIEQGEDQGFVEAFSVQAARVLDLQVQYRPGDSLPNQPRQSARFDVWQLMIENALRRELLGVMDRPFVVYSALDKKETIYVAVRLTNGVLTISLPRRRLFSSSSYIFLLWMIGSSLVLLLVAIVFMRNQIRPIRRLAIAAERFGKGRDIGAFKPSGAREVRQASEAFIKMHERIRRQIEQRTLMLAGVSHDLRTPLTRLKLQAEILEDSEDSRAIKNDISDMQTMINGYLDFLRDQSGESQETVNTSAFFAKIQTMVQRQNIQAVFVFDDNLPGFITVKPMALERCLMNIIGNAMTYGDTVWASVQCDQKGLRIIIEDNGPGIPEDKYEDVFRPFFRLDESRSNATGHVGLGLPIAQDIIHDHGGEIILGQSEKGGLRVDIHLPL